MNKKKIFTDIFAIIIAFALFVLWHDNKYENNLITASSTNNYTVYLITMEKNTDFVKDVNQGASDMANLLGLKYKWDAPQERIAEDQITIINNAVSAGANAILITAIDPVKISEAIKNAKAAGVKIVYLDSPANEEGVVTLATDNYGAGVTAGVSMINELEAEGIRSGSIGIVNVSKGNIAFMNREKGFSDALEADGRFKLLDSKYTMGDETISREVSDAFINNNPDLVGLFATNENTTKSIGEAIKASNKKIIGIGFNITKAIQNLLRAGYLKVVMEQNPYTMGYLGMSEAFAALKEYDTGPSYINTGVRAITR